MNALRDNVRGMCQNYTKYVRQEQTRLDHERNLREEQAQCEYEQKLREKMKNDDELTQKKSEIEQIYVDAFFNSKHKINFDVDPSKIMSYNGAEIARFGTGVASGENDSPDKDALSVVFDKVDKTRLKTFCSNDYVFQRCELIAKKVNHHIDSLDGIRIYCQLHDLSGYDFDDIAELKVEAINKKLRY